MEKLKVTTILTTYRRPKRLKRAIESVLQQTYSHFKLIVLDDASDDGTREVVMSYCDEDGRIEYICHKKNKGMGANFNFGYQLIDTPYFSFLSDDDVLLPNFYEDSLKQMEKYPDVGCCAGGSIQMSEDGEITKITLKERKEEEYYEDGITEVMADDFPNWNSVLFRHEVKKQIPSLSLDAAALQDFDFMLKVSLDHPILLMKKICAFFIDQPTSFTRLCDPMTHWKASRFTHQEVIVQMENFLQNRFHAICLKRLYFLAMRHLGRGNIKIAKSVIPILDQEDLDGVYYFPLKILAGASEKIPLFLHVLSLMMKLRRLIKKRVRKMRFHDYRRVYWKWYESF